MKRAVVWAVAASVLAACAAAAAAPSKQVRNRYLLTLKLTAVLRVKESVNCDSGPDAVTWTMKRTTVRTRRPTPVWLGMVNLDPHHPKPPPPKRFLPIWGGIHGFHGHGPLLIPLRLRTSTLHHLETCGGSPVEKRKVANRPTRGDFASTTFGHVGRMNLDIAADVFAGYPAPSRPRLQGRVKVKRLLAGKSVHFGQKRVRAHMKLGRVTASVRAKWHAFVRPARG
jgi:hypothetical protein